MWLVDESGLEEMSLKFLGKSLFDPFTDQGDTLYPRTMKSSILLPKLFETGQITYSNSGCYSNNDFVFFFFIYFRWIFEKS
jgi:hypothetical protein